MYLSTKVAVVVPAYCEARLLPQTLESIPEYIDQIIVVDDGSPDETFAVATKCATRDGRITVVRLGYNYGVGRAIIAGYEEALSTGAEVVAVMAADNQMDPADLPLLLAPLIQGEADYTKGNRLAHNDACQMPFVRRVGSRILARATGLIAGMAFLDDAQCGYTAIRVSTLRKLPLAQIYPRYGYPNDMLIRLSECGARVVQPAVRPVYADEISGLSIPRVIGPISGILARGLLRKTRQKAVHKMIGMSTRHNSTFKSFLSAASILIAY